MALSIEERIKAEQQVEAFIEVLANRYNLKEDEIPELIDNIKWIGHRRSGISRISWASILGLAALATSGLAAAVWEGFKSLVAK